MTKSGLAAAFGVFALAASAASAAFAVADPVVIPPPIRSTNDHANVAGHQYRTFEVTNTLRNPPSVFLDIPNEYTSEETRSSGTGFIIFASYPNMRGPRSLGNKGLTGCKIYCHDELMIGIENPNDKYFDPNKLERTLSGSIPDNLRKSIHSPPQFDYAISGVSSINTGGSALNQSKIFYVKYNDISGSNGSVVVCNYFVPNPSCDGYFKTSDKPELEIQTHFFADKLPIWPSIRESEIRLIRSFKPRNILN